ncbi:MAG TPA: DUF1559 domain-containing protein [Gemmataceae bacterium]
MIVLEEPQPLEAVQANLPLRRAEEALEEKGEIEDRPRRGQPSNTSRKAVTSLVLGILSLFCNVLTGVPALILALLAFRDIGRSRGRLSGQGLAIAGIATACVCTLLSCGIVIPVTSMSVGLLLPAVQKVREADNRKTSINSLILLGLGMQHYQMVNGGRFPAAAICDKEGKPLLSWRVAILPYIQQEHLYNQFNRDEPWDSPNNKKLIARMPLIYKLPGDETPSSNTTHYQVFVGNGAAFDKTRGHLLQEFRDGRSNTILIVVAENAVPWTKPEDLEFDPRSPILPLMSGHFQGGFLVILGDGSIHVIPQDISENSLKAAITRSGGEEFLRKW